MFDLSNFIAAVRHMAQVATPAIPATLEAGRALVELAQAIAPTLAEADQRKLQAALPALLERMNVHVDAAVADLTGGAQ